MKKVLLGTSAIALAGAFASPAAAVEWTVRVGGYMEQYVAYADVDPKSDGVGNGAFDGDEDFDGIDSKQDAEIHFLPKIVLDNGIEIGADIQLEGASTPSDQIDESFMRIKGSFGEINLGSENSAGYKMFYAAPDVTFLNVNSGSLTAFVPYSGLGFTGQDVFRGTLGTTFLENERNNDAQRFTYYTPRFAGFQVGLSYARDGNQDSNAQLDIEGGVSGPGPVALHDIFDVGANYVNSFGGIDVALSGRWGTASDDTGSNPDIWGVGGNLGYGGFTIGGSYAEQNDAETEDGEAWDAGVSYETGPWGFSFTYFHGENVNEESATLDDEELDQYLLGVSYALAQGVALNAYGAYVDFEEDNADPFGPDDVDGWVIGTGIKISF